MRVAVLSTHAHASIKRIDVAAARAAPGVALVLTGVDALAEDIGGIPPHFMPEHWGGPKGFGTLRPVLLADRVRCVGDRVAFVVAETEAQARDAAELVEVEYELLPAVISLEDAVKPSAPKIWEDCPSGNSAVTISFGDKAATDAAFANAKYVVALRLENNRVTANAIEPRCAIGDSAGVVTRSTRRRRIRTALRSKLAAAILHVPETKIRVVSPDVGGGFGMKSNIYPDDVLVLWASRRLGRPVKWTATRSEALLLDTQARDQVVYGELALDGDGKFLGLRAKAYQALGAYWWAAITAPLFFSLMLIPSVYDVQAVELSTQAVFTNTAPTSVYRGAGRPEAIYLIERLIDRAAQVSGIDRVEIRRRNLIAPSALPYHTATHHNYDSGEFARVMDNCLDIAEWDGVRGPARREQAERQTARTRGHPLYRARRSVQRAHGASLRSERHGLDRCRDAFARTGSRNRVRAARVGMAWRAIRGHPIHSRGHCAGRVRPRHVRGAQLHGRWRGVAGRSRRHHRARQGDGRRAHGGGRRTTSSSGRVSSRWSAPTNRLR